VKKHSPDMVKRKGQKFAERLNAGGTGRGEKGGQKSAANQNVLERVRGKGKLHFSERLGINL